jgi:hypothetical protein
MNTDILFKFKGGDGSSFIKTQSKIMVLPTWRCPPVIPALGRLRQDDHEFLPSLCYIVSSKPALHNETLSQKISQFKKLIFQEIIETT